MQKVTTILLFISLTYSALLASTGFQNSYGTTACYEEASSVVPNSTGYLVSAAYNCGGGSSNWNSYFIAIDSIGDTLWSTKNLQANGKMVALANSDLIFAGGNTAGNTYDTIQITRTNAQGQTLWSTPLAFNACKNTVSSIKKVTDGVVITGYYPSGSCTLPVYDAFVAKLDLNGQVVWTTIVDGSDHEQLHDAVEMADGGVAAFGWTNTETTNPLNEYLLVFIDENGKLDRREQFGNEFNNFGYGIELAYDGGLITNGYGNQMEVYKFDSEGKRQWANFYEASCGSTYFSVKRTTDGGYAFLGTEDVNGQCNSFLMKTDTDGNVFWKKHWNVRLREFTENTDGSFVLAGYASYLPDAVVILFDSTSLPQPTPTTPTDTTVTNDTSEVSNPKDQDVSQYLDDMDIETSVDEEELNQRTIKLYPNPTTTDLYIEFSNKEASEYHLSIYSVNGQLIYYQDGITTEKIHVDMSEVANGAYVYRLSNNTNIYAGQFIVQ